MSCPPTFHHGATQGCAGDKLTPLRNIKSERGGGSRPPTSKLAWVGGQPWPGSGDQTAGGGGGTGPRVAAGGGFCAAGPPAPPACAGAEPLPAGQLRSERFRKQPSRRSGPCEFGGPRGRWAEAPASASRGVLRSVDMNPVVVVHGGGASNISKDRKERVRQGIVRAATVGYNILKEGGSAVDAVEGAVTVLEDDPEFNAGCGSVLNVNGEVEMDASIMNGKDLSSGAVSAVRCIANPIKLARLVMEKTPHCFLTDQGAAKFAADMGIPEVPEKQLITERNIKHLEKEKNEKSAQKTDQEKNLGTVGAVALDSEGNVAYATSTGGIVNKMAGRVGDTPCIGSGGYADNDIGAISTTGHGESILKVNLARLTLFHLEQGKTLEEAADSSLGYMKSKLKGLGGVILINTAGDWAVKWTSASMPWAAAKDGKLHSGIDLDETSIADLP